MWTRFLRNLMAQHALKMSHCSSGGGYGGASHCSSEASHCSSGETLYRKAGYGHCATYEPVGRAYGHCGINTFEGSGLGMELLMRAADGDNVACVKLMQMAANRVNMMPPQMPKIADEDLPKYNGGLTAMDWCGGWQFPLPIPDEGKKWVVRLYDTKGGDIIPELVQAPKDEPVSAWKDGYPKYDKE